MAVRVMRYEIVGWSGDPKEAKARWRTIADTCREVMNALWQQWECWHVERGSDTACRQWRDHLIECRQRGEKGPKLDVKPVPPELSTRLYALTRERFPGLIARTRCLLIKRFTEALGSKDTEGRYNVWIAVLLNRQGRPSCAGDQPIPFDRQQAKVTRDEKGFRLAIKLTRTEHDDKAGSIEDTVRLKARGSGAAIAERIVSGEYKFCGSSIVYQASRQKWYCLLCYDAGDSEKAAVNPKKQAVLHPRKDRPWCLWIDGGDVWVGGRGGHIIAARRRLLTGRWERQEGYRYGGSSNKGHGRKRALQGVTKLSRGWKDTTKTINHQLTREVVDACIQRGIGTLVYLQPVAERHRTSRFLTTAGKVEGRTDGTSWDYAQVATMLAYKCKDAGIHFVVNKCNASGRFREAEKKPKKKGRSQKRTGGEAA